MIGQLQTGWGGRGLARVVEEGIFQIESVFSLHSGVLHDRFNVHIVRLPVEFMYYLSFTIYFFFTNDLMPTSYFS